MGDMSLGIVGFVSHLAQSLPVALGMAMSFVYRKQPRVALTFIGDGASSTGLGLSIVTDIAVLYGGRFQLLDSPLGPLRCELVLPAL